MQFVYRHWQSGAPVPTTPHSLLDLIGRVLERQSMVPDAGPIILHCRDGSAENGLFCCVSLLLERLKAEHMVDVFRTVMSLQLQRPLLFNKVVRDPGAIPWAHSPGFRSSTRSATSASSSTSIRAINARIGSKRTVLAISDNSRISFTFIIPFS